jgi:hypothetical protein
MAKQIKLTESDLKSIIRKSVVRFIKENADEVLDTPERAIHYSLAATADKKNHPGRGKDSKDPAIRARRDRQAKAGGDKAADLINQEMGDPDFMAIGDRGARRMMYAKGPNSAYLTNDIEDLDSTKIYNDNFQDGDEPMTIGSLPDDERARIHNRFNQFKGYHDRARELDDKYLEEKVNRLVKKTLRRKLNEMVEDGITAKARELYRDVDWDDYEIDDVDGGYATGTIYGSVEDENGGVWQFVGGAGFNWEGDWELDTIEDVEFTSPDGQEGSL